MRSTLVAMLDSRHAVRVAALITLALGYFFIFAWAPHPWSWQGIDSYHELAKALARGEPFQTTDVPWGYAYYAALFYKLFGDRIWVPLVVQATLNAAVPYLLYLLVLPLAGRRVAVLSALIAGVFSFNTIYASTQSSDTICTVLFLAALLSFSRGVRQQSMPAFIVSGILLGIVPQFRPNMVAFPGLVVLAYLLAPPRTAAKITQMAAFAVMVTLLQLPWIVRNYQLTGLFLPTSTHGGVQLWYGTLQVGEHLESRAHNPRFYFASPAFTYTSLWKRPIEISSVHRDCAAPAPTQLVYWTDRDTARRDIAASHDPARPNVDLFTLPAQPNHSTLYYYFEQAHADGARFTAPLGGPANPNVAFISDDHLGDLDQHDDVIDLFDIVRLLRHIAWQEPLRAAAKLDVNGDGITDAADVEAIVTALLPDLAKAPVTGALTTVVPSDSKVELRLADGSWIAVPKVFGGKQTDVDVSLDGQMAPALLSRTRTFTSLAQFAPACMPADEVMFNAPFYLGEPHMMQRFMALATDNIRRDPMAFARASLYRMMRLFIVRGSDDVSTAQQFHRSDLVYNVGSALSIGYLVIFFVGVAIAIRRRSALLLFLLPIVYVPVTICFVLTNMRYTVTMQPLMFAFVALAIATLLRIDAPDGAGGTYRVRPRT